MTINVIIPAYNCRDTLDRTLHSLACQFDTDFVVTIMDDNSTEPFSDVIDRFKMDLDIRVIRNTKNLGCGTTRQVGIDNNDCDYFTFLDSDDIAMPNMISMLRNSAIAHPDCGLISGGIYGVKSDRLYRLKNIGYCHAKLYKASDIAKYNIRNSSEIRWSDDAYFNYMVRGLCKEHVITTEPMHIYTYNPNSIMHKSDSEREHLHRFDYLTAVLRSAEHVRKYNGDLSHLTRIINSSDTSNMRSDERSRYNEIVNLMKEVQL